MPAAVHTFHRQQPYLKVVKAAEEGLGNLEKGIS